MELEMRFNQSSLELEPSGAICSSLLLLCRCSCFEQVLVVTA